jgi:hypothetical protein
MPRIHHREQQCREAESALRKAILDWCEAHPDLTTAEHLRVVHTIFSEHIHGFLKHVIRVERHGDGDKPGGLE